MHKRRRRTSGNDRVYNIDGGKGVERQAARAKEREPGLKTSDQVRCCTHHSTRTLQSESKMALKYLSISPLATFAMLYRASQA